MDDGWRDKTLRMPNILFRVDGCSVLLSRSEYLIAVFCKTDPTALGVRQLFFLSISGDLKQ